MIRHYQLTEIIIGAIAVCTQFSTGRTALQWVWCTDDGLVVQFSLSRSCAPLCNVTHYRQLVEPSCGFGRRHAAAPARPSGGRRSGQWCMPQAQAQAVFFGRVSCLHAARSSELKDSALLVACWARRAPDFAPGTQVPSLAFPSRMKVLAFVSWSAMLLSRCSMLLFRAR